MKSLKKRTIYIIVAIVIFIFVVVSSCENKSKNNNGYSHEYNNDSNYRKNVDDIAEAFGKDSKYVDKSIHSITGD